MIGRCRKANNIEILIERSYDSIDISYTDSNN